MTSIDSRRDEEKKEEEDHITEVNTNTLSQTSTEESDEQRTLWQNVKKYRKVAWITLGLTSAILLYGYDNVIVGTVSGMPKFQEDFGVLHDNKWILPSSWLALWNVASPLGAMIGAVFGGWFQDRVGRRVSLGLCSFLSAISVAIMFVSYLPADKNGRRACFLMGRFFNGSSIGAVMAATQTYMSEVLPVSLRGSGMSLFPVFTLLGQLTGALVIFGSLHKPKGYAVAFGSQWPFSFVPILVALLIPDSPTWFVRKRKTDQALKAQARLDPAGVDTKAVVEKIVADIAHEEATQARSTYTECFHRRNFRRTFIVLWVNSLQGVFGLPLLAKASYFLQVVGMSANFSIIFLILGIVLGLFANTVSVWVVARVGRRKLILTTLGVASLLWLGMGIANCFKSGVVVWWTAITGMLIIVVCGVGVWPASFAVSAETSSLQLRAKTQGLGWMVSAFSSAASGIALPYIFNPDAGNLRGKVGFTYVATCLIGFAISWYLVPEMKGRSVSEIDRMFELKVPVRQFKNWRDDRVERDEAGQLSV